MKYDIIIIGAGLGGLTTGATLAKKGKKVLVLEQHNIPGGAATTYTRKGIKFEVGLHEMDWGTPNRDMKALVFKKLGILDTLPLVELPQTWRIKTEKEEYTIPHGRKNVINYLSEKFPTEKAGVKKYFADMKYITATNKCFPNDFHPIEFLLYPIMTFPSVLYGMWQNISTGHKLDKLFKSDRLKSILNINHVYFTDNPYELSWYYHASAQYSYYHKSVYIKGGSQVLSNQLADKITENGGEIRYFADVKKIELEGNKATGVTYQDRKTKELITVTGKKIIANCSPDSVFNGNMIPTEFREEQIESKKVSTSLWTIYITYKEALSKKFPGTAYSTFFQTEEQLNSPQNTLLHENTKKALEDRGFVMVDYSAIDSGLVPEGDPRGFGVLCGCSHIEEWESNINKEEYKAKKENFAKHLFTVVEKHYPGFTENIEYFEVSTPKTIERYMKTPKGAVFGYKQIGYCFPGSRAPRQAHKVKNLHFTGAWCLPGGGFTGAILAGYYTAIDLILPMPIRIILGTLGCFFSIEILIFLIKTFVAK